MLLKWSRKRESNPPESAWEADAIPLGDSCKHEIFLNVLRNKTMDIIS